MTTATRWSREASTDAIRAGRRDLHVLRVGEIRIDLAPGQAGTARARCQGARPDARSMTVVLSPLDEHGLRLSARKDPPDQAGRSGVHPHHREQPHGRLHRPARRRARRAQLRQPVGVQRALATHYIARDGWALEAIDWRRYAAWSNGDVTARTRRTRHQARRWRCGPRATTRTRPTGSRPRTSATARRYPITAAQKQAIAELIVEASRLSGLAVTRETVHGHWEINGVDRRNCPAPYAQREAFLADVIAARRPCSPHRRPRRRP